MAKAEIEMLFIRVQVILRRTRQFDSDAATINPSVGSSNPAQVIRPPG
jgi:hypothetical protein